MDTRAKYASMASNLTLANIIAKYCEKRYSGNRANKRPDLLLNQDYTDSYLLIEFKRPTHDISRDDISQAEKYRDDLSHNLLSNKRIDIIMLGKGRTSSLNISNLAPNIHIHSYASMISSARSELDWLMKSLA